MLNVIDIIVAVLVLLQLLRSFGSPGRIVKGLLVILVLLIVFGIIARLLMEVKLPEAASKTLKESYTVNLSISLIKFVYPAIEKNAPTVNTFIKDKIITMPTKEVKVPKVVIPDKMVPNMTIPAILKPE